MSNQNGGRSGRGMAAVREDSDGFGGLGLSKRALAAVEELGYDEPTPVQSLAIPQVIAGKDVMAAAQTGTGKTAAFLLPALDGLGHASKGEGPLMLVVTPTRELTQQIEDAAELICRHTGHRTVEIGRASCRERV